MSLSVIASASVAAATFTTPTHAVGDLIVVFAYRSSSGTAATLAAGFTNVNNGGANTNAVRIAYRVATGTNSTSDPAGTWTNASQLHYAIYRTSQLGSGYTVAVGASARTDGAASTTVTVPALTLQNTTGTSWVHCGFGQKTATTVGAMTGLTTLTSQGTNPLTRASNSNAGVTSWAGTSGTADTSAAFESVSVEIREVAPPPITWVGEYILQGGTTSLTLAPPGSTAAGDLDIIWVADKNSSVSPSTPTGGWTLLGQAAVGTGADGDGTGQIKLTAWYRVLSGASTSTSVTITGANRSLGGGMVYRKVDAGATWAPTISFGSDVVSDVSFSSTVAANLAATEGDYVWSIGLTTINTSAGSRSITIPGVPSTLTGISSGGSATANQMFSWSDHAHVDAFVQTSASTTVATAGVATTGGCFNIRIGVAFTGTSATTKAADTATATGTFTGSGATGTAAPTQAAQTASATGTLGYTGTSSAAQASNASSAAGQLGYTGTSAPSQAPQASTASGTSSPPASGTAAVSQAAQVSAATGILGYTGTATPAQAANVATAAGILGYSGTAAVTQSAQSPTATGGLGYTGTVGAAQAANTATATGTVTVPVTGASAATQAANAPTAVGQLGYSGSSAVSQTANTATGAGHLGYTGTTSGTQASQVAVATGQLQYTGTASTTQGPDTASASGTAVITGIAGNAAPVQAPQTPAAAGVLGYSGTAPANQADQTSTATGKLGYTATSAATQANQTAAGSGISADGIAGSAAAIQANQTATATGKLGYTGTAAATQASDTALGAGQVMAPITGTASATQDNQAATVTGQLRYTATVAVTQSGNGCAAVAVFFFPVTGTSAATQTNQTATATGSVLGQTVLRPDLGRTPRTASDPTVRPSAGVTPRL